MTSLLTPTDQETSEPQLTRSQVLARYARTVSHFQARQVVARIRLRVQRRATRTAPTVAQRIMLHRVVPSGPPGWPEAFEPLDRRRFSDCVVAEELLAGRLTLLNRSEDRSGGAIWTRTDLPQLWSFHASYWDWAWHLTALGDRGTFGIEEIWNEWVRSTKFGRMDAWSPYVVSLRLWTLSGLHARVAARPELQDGLATAVLVHAAYLRSNVESDVGGNHIIKNLKALVGAGVFLGDERLTRWAIHRLQAGLKTQILEDGGHFELSPSYHGQVLGDLIDIVGLVASSGVSVSIHEVEQSIEVMRSWLAEFVGPDGSTPVLNDGVALDDRELTLLGVTAPAPSRRLVLLEQSGYAIARPRPDVHVIFDVGQPGPEALPAHAHADCLSLAVGNTEGWIVVDTGTSEYGAGKRRQFERSTAAHSTVEVDGTNQTEVWGAFRAGRRARATLLSALDDGQCITLIAEHDGYRKLDGQPIHRRHLTLRGGELIITDEVLGSGYHKVCSRVHLADGVVIRESDSTVAWHHGASAMTVHGDHIRMHASEYSTEFGTRAPGSTLVQERRVTLPTAIRWKVSI